MYLAKDSVITYYVDNCIIFLKDNKKIKEVYIQLRDRKFIFIEKEDIT